MSHIFDIIRELLNESNSDELYKKLVYGPNNINPKQKNPSYPEYRNIIRTNLKYNDSRMIQIYVKYYNLRKTENPNNSLGQSLIIILKAIYGIEKDDPRINEIKKIIEGKAHVTGPSAALAPTERKRKASKDASAELPAVQQRRNSTRKTTVPPAPPPPPPAPPPPPPPAPSPAKLKIDEAHEQHIIRQFKAIKDAANDIMYIRNIIDRFNFNTSNVIEYVFIFEFILNMLYYQNKFSNVASLDLISDDDKTDFIHTYETIVYYLNADMPKTTQKIKCTADNNQVFDCSKVTIKDERSLIENKDQYKLSANFINNIKKFFNTSISDGDENKVLKFPADNDPIRKRNPDLSFNDKYSIYEYLRYFIENNKVYLHDNNVTQKILKFYTEEMMTINVYKYNLFRSNCRLKYTGQSVSNKSKTISISQVPCCYICGYPILYTLTNAKAAKINNKGMFLNSAIDHIVPAIPAYTLGIIQCPLNFLPTHYKCNGAKNDKLPTIPNTYQHIPDLNPIGYNEPTPVPVLPDFEMQEAIGGRKTLPTFALSKTKLPTNNLDILLVYFNKEYNNYKKYYDTKSIVIINMLKEILHFLYIIKLIKNKKQKSKIGSGKARSVQLRRTPPEDVEDEHEAKSDNAADKKELKSLYDSLRQFLSLMDNESLNNIIGVQYNSVGTQKDMFENRWDINERIEFLKNRFLILFDYCETSYTPSEIIARWESAKKSSEIIKGIRLI